MVSDLAISNPIFDDDIESQMIGEYELTEAAKKTTSKDFGLANELSHIDEIIGIYENNNILEHLLCRLIGVFGGFLRHGRRDLVL